MKRLLSFLILLSISSCFASPASSGLKNDEYYMQVAFELALKNKKAPFGAVIVDNNTGKILAGGLNASTVNPTFHGEMVAINNFNQTKKHPTWSQVTLYTTAEPCAMCQGAIIWAGIPRVVYATSLEYLKSHGWDQIDIKAEEVNKRAPFYKGQITGGVLAEKTNTLFNLNRS